MHSHDYVELLIRQTLTPQGKSLTDRPVFHIIVQGTYNPACDFHRTGLSTVPAVVAGYAGSRGWESCYSAIGTG